METIDKVKQMIANGVLKQEDAEKYFPELKESDERIRKGLIQYFSTFTLNTFAGLDPKKILSWLEKQREKPAGKVEPKFHEGDYAVSNLDGKTRRISEVHYDEYNSYYVVDGNFVNLEEYDRLHHIWTIQDAKDGDVLVASDDSIFLFKDTIDCACKHYVALTTDGIVKFNEGLEHFWETSTSVHPATKEQRDALMDAVADAGYIFDFKKKELKKIEQNPAWSEDDGNRINRLIAYFEDKESFTAEDDVVYANWLKSLKDRVQLKQEWSEEDETALGDALWCCKQAASIAKNENDMGNVWYAETWLKSLKPHNTWKPSDEQMNALHDAAVYVDKSMFPYPKGILMKLYKQLKKLREE